jgi:NADPH:quinone reductase-like Zn-dependent oxidoreductase
MASTSPKAILFLGATGNVGLSALRRSLAAGHTCIAICRTPSKLTDKLGSSPANLVLVQGNAHDAAVLERGLAHPSKPNTFVDVVSSSIGGAFLFPAMKIDDPTVCGRGMKILLDTIAELRRKGYTGRPHIVGVSSTGLSTVARDVPVLFVPLYHVVLKKPHEDKRAMEELLFASGEDWTVVRASALTDAVESADGIRVGKEDPIAKRVISEAIGYTISREDAGKWIYENIVEKKDDEWVAKVATVTN